MTDDRLILACDPDLHHSGLALVRLADGVPVWVGVGNTTGETGDEAVLVQLKCLQNRMPGYTVYGSIVESQEIAYTARQGMNPRSMIPVAHVAGGVAAMFNAVYSPSIQYLVKPQFWKGSVRKGIHQARTLAKLGWSYEVIGSGDDKYCRPLNTPPVSGAENLNKGDWKHVVDAIALGMWLAAKLREIESRRPV